MKRLPYIFVAIVLMTLNTACDRFWKKPLVIYDTICTDTIISEADLALYGTIGAKSDYRTLYLHTYDDTLVFTLDNPVILGQYTIGDRVAVLPTGSGTASRVVDITTLMAHWEMSDSSGVVRAFSLEADGQIVAMSGDSRHYHSWELVNTRLAISYNSDKTSHDTIADTLPILKLTTDSLVLERKESRIGFRRRGQE